MGRFFSYVIISIMESITKSRSYKHLMTLMNNAGIIDRRERLDIARKILDKPLRSFQYLDSDDVLVLIDHFNSWKKIQELRFVNSTMFIESSMIMDVLNDDTKGLLSDRSILSTKKSRSKWMKDYQLEEKDYQVSEDDMSSILSEVTTGLDIKEKRLSIDSGRWPSWKCIPAPTVGLGLATNIGGIPRGKITHIWGQKHGGKSYLTFSIIAQAQKQGIPCILIDTEAAATGELVKDLGVDVDKLVVYTPSNLETVCTMLRKLSNKPALVVVDSIAASESSVELERNISKDAPRVAGNAQLWKSTLSIVRPNLVDSGGAFILVNQVRKNLNAGPYGNPDKPYGADAIHHNVDLSMVVRPVKEKNNTLEGNGYKISRLAFDKNRFGELATTDISFRPGFPYDKNVDLVRTCGETIAKGSKKTYGEIADNAILKGYIADPQNGDLVAKKNRWVIRVDSYLMAALLEDDPDFDEVDIEPIPVEEFDITEVPNVDTENSEYFTIPKLGEVNAAAFFKKHPTTAYVIGERLLNSLEKKHEVLKKDMDM